MRTLIRKVISFFLLIRSLINLCFALFYKDTSINSPFQSVDFLKNMKTILQTNQCSITPECHLKGKKSN